MLTRSTSGSNVVVVVAAPGAEDSAVTQYAVPGGSATAMVTSNASSPTHATDWIAGRRSVFVTQTATGTLR